MTAKSADLTLASDVHERGTLLLGLTEDQWFDRKSSRLGARQLGEVLVGFANADGGFIIIGLSGGRVEGINAAGPGSLSGWQQAAMDFTMPAVPCDTRLVECINHRGDADRLLVVQVEASGVVHTTTDDTAFLRVGDETRKLRFDQRRELLADKGQATYEATVLRDVSVADLDAERLSEYAQAAGSSDPKRLLVARGLLTASDEVTVAAALLFAPIPQTCAPPGRCARRALSRSRTRLRTPPANRLRCALRRSAATPAQRSARGDCGLGPQSARLGIQGSIRGHTDHSRRCMARRLGQRRSASLLQLRR